ncbi:MAG: InlB B-repeat-containing protein [Defluviitaleaceae bacterium]|nr:InlB B-repeat-containing protein [Defluviitaleaceae bacterium]
MYDFLFWPTIPNWHLFEDWGLNIDIFIRQSRLFEADSIIITDIWGVVPRGGTWHFGQTLEPGIHELRFRAAFGLQDDTRQVEVWSNTITLTVEPPPEITHTVTFLPGNGGSFGLLTIASITRSVAHNAPLGELPFVINRPDYVLAGWYDTNAPTGGTRWYADTPVTGDVTLYARWEERVVTPDDFVLTISVEETTLRQGENFTVNVELKNISDEDIEIYHGPWLFIPSIPNWNASAELLTPRSSSHTRLMEPGSILKNMNYFQGDESAPWLIGHTLEPGTHELRFRAEFGLLKIGDTAQPGVVHQEEVWSNTITLTVEPPPEIIHTVTFSPGNGGSFGVLTVASISRNVAHNAPLGELPCVINLNPGYILAGWYDTDELTGGTRWYADTPVTGDVTLYARWEWVVFTPDDFVLTIRARETVLPQNSWFSIYIGLLNDSGRDIEIAHNFLFWPEIPGWCLFDEWKIDVPPPSLPHITFFEANSVLRNINIVGNEAEFWDFGTTLVPGTHELSFRANFEIEATGQQLEIWSNTIRLTVE